MTATALVELRRYRQELAELTAALPPSETPQGVYEGLVDAVQGLDEALEAARRG